jgi:hypothetical protein
MKTSPNTAYQTRRTKDSRKLTQQKTIEKTATTEKEH